MKTFTKTLATAALVLSFLPMAASADSIVRTGAKLAGEATYVTVIQLRGDGTQMTITTERYAKGRTFEGDVTVYPTGSFNPHSYKSVAKFVRAELGAGVLDDEPTSDHYLTAGADGVMGTPDDTRVTNDGNF